MASATKIMNMRKTFSFLKSKEKGGYEDGAPRAEPSGRLHKGRPRPLRTEGLGAQDVQSPSTASPKTPHSLKNGQQCELKSGSRVSSMLNLNKNRPSTIVGSWNRGDSPSFAVDTGLNTARFWRKEQHGSLKQEDIIHHGEIQVPGPPLRGLGNVQSKRQYAILTVHRFIRFKNRREAFQWISELQEVDHGDAFPSLSRSATGLVNSPSSISNSDICAVDLADIVSVYNLDDGRPYFTIELACLQEREREGPLTWVVTVHIEEPHHFEIWLHKLRLACRAASHERLWEAESPLLRHAIEWMGQDFQADASSIFKVVQRVGSGDSTNVLAKFNTSVCLLAVGQYRIHIIPIPKVDKNQSIQPVKSAPSRSHGLMCLTNLRSQVFDETFHLHFRLPLQETVRYVFSSSSVSDIMDSIWQALSLLRPAWQDLPFDWIVPEAPRDLGPTMPNIPHPFIRTLEAYCEAYNYSASSIKWRQEDNVEDAPRFVLLPPEDEFSRPYGTLELLAVMRALRYDEWYCSLSFAEVDLSPLQLPDVHGSDHELWRTHGHQTGMSNQQEHPLSLLMLEVRALLLASKKLRRVDFSGSLPRSHFKGSQVEDRRGSLVEAIVPLCERQLTNVDWICLNDIYMSRDDVSFLYNALTRKACHLRAVELKGCGLEDQDLKNLLESCSIQENTMESVNISTNPGLLEPRSLALGLGSLRHLRRLELADANVGCRGQPLLTYELLSTWRLERLQLSGTSLDGLCLKHLTQYLESPISMCLAWLDLCRCKLTGGDIGRLLGAMHRGGKIRRIRFEVSSNNLEGSGEHWQLTEAIRRSETPAHMVMEKYEYRDGIEYEKLIRAFGENTTTTHLNISGVAPRHIARHDEGPFEAIASMLAENTMLETLELSGEVGHVDATNLGGKLGSALRGLEFNSTLAGLTVEYQNLGFAGAGALADMISRGCRLRSLHLDNNDINLQGFTTMVDAVEGNHSLVEMSLLDNDCAKDMKKIMDEESKSTVDNSPTSKRTFGRTVKKAVMDQTPFGTRFGRRYTFDGNLSDAVRTRDEMWQKQRERLQRLLDRNDRIGWEGTSVSRVMGKEAFGEKGHGLDDTKTELDMKHDSASSTPSCASEAGLEMRTTNLSLSTKVSLEKSLTGAGV